MLEELKIAPLHKNNLFGEIPADWKYVTFEDVLDGFSSGSTPSRGIPEFFKGEILWITSGELDYNVIYDTKEKVTEEAVKSANLKILKPGTFLFAITGLEAAGTRGSCAIVGKEATTNQSCMALTPKKEIDINFFFFFYCHYGNHLAFRFCQGTKQQSYNGSIVRKLPLVLPPLREQQKIAEILSTWDQAISTTQKLIIERKNRRKGLMQQIFKGNLRFKKKNGIEYQEWKPKKLRHYLKVSKAKNEDLKYTEDNVLSVSGEYGIVNQIEFHGRSFAGASVANYGVVETGDIVYTKSPLKANPYGIIKVNKGQPRIVSTLYATYKCKPTVNGEFVGYYFQLDDNVNRYLRPLVQKGTKNDMKINNEKVLIDEVLFPSLEEQNAIVVFFKTINSEIVQTKEYLETLKKQKKGLMQKLLTGEIRVKPNN